MLSCTSGVNLPERSEASGVEVDHTGACFCVFFIHQCHGGVLARENVKNCDSQREEVSHSLPAPQWQGRF